MPVLKEVNRKLGRVIGVGAVVVAVGLSGALPASAAAAPEPSSTPTEESPGSEETCLIDLRTQTERCFANFREFTSTLTGGRFVVDNPAELSEEKVAQFDAAAAAESAAKARAAGTAAPKAAVLVGVLFADAGWRGTTTPIQGNRCEWGNPAQYLDVIPRGWNDRVSSFHSYNNCSTILYENGGGRGRSYGPKVSATLGADYMNDKASSLAYRAA